jgi:hypothetical protein
LPKLYKKYYIYQKKILAEALEKYINFYFKGSQRLSKQKLVGFIKKDFPDWSDNTINIYLSKLKKNGIISAPSRGIYKFDSSNPFQPKISGKLKRIFNKIKREFPFIIFCVWDTIWLNDLMRHQPLKHYIVIEVEKDAFESVFAFLTETKKGVFLNPSEEIFDRYINNLDEAIIVKNLISEAPLIGLENITIASVEKLLVDMMIDIDLFSAQQNEKDFIMKSSIDKFTLNELKMLRYAMRRNREKEVNALIDKALAN